MGDKEETSRSGRYLNGTYLMLGCVASVVAIVTGIIAMHEKKDSPAADPAAGKSPTIHVEVPAPPSAPFAPPALPPPPGPPKPGSG